jgi:hypothetical protein
MSFLATCTFDLRNASPEDYENAYSDLRVIGFQTSLVSSAGNTIRSDNNDRRRVHWHGCDRSGRRPDSTR